MSWDYDNFLFVIEDKYNDEGYDNTNDYIKNIENIYEPFAQFSFVNHKNYYLKFKIINDE